MAVSIVQFHDGSQQAVGVGIGVTCEPVIDKYTVGVIRVMVVR